MKNTINRLHELISQLITLLEGDIDELQFSTLKNSINIKRNIADMLNKLVSLIIQLNRLDSDSSINGVKQIIQEDKEIIRRFIDRYKNGI